MQDLIKDIDHIILLLINTILFCDNKRLRSLKQTYNLDIINYTPKLSTLQHQSSQHQNKLLQFFPKESQYWGESRKQFLLLN